MVGFKAESEDNTEKEAVASEEEDMIAVVDAEDGMSKVVGIIHIRCNNGKVQ